MTYYVISRYFDNGTVEADLLPESEYQGQQPLSNRQLDQYVDTFENFNDAERYQKDCLLMSSRKTGNRCPITQ